MRIAKALPLCPLLLLLVCSCVSSKRMMRISPLADDYYHHRESVPDSTMADNRRNYWPFFYRNLDETSCMWPMIDADKHGFAVRPFYNQDDDEYSILFPLAAWNPVNGDGWVMLGYWDVKGKQYGFFPLVMVNKDFSFVMPVWWDDEALGVLLSRFSSKGLNFAGPFYVDFSEKLGTYGGLFPILQVGHPEENWFFPLYINLNDKDSSLHVLLLNILARIENFKNGDFDCWILPFYYGRDHTRTTTLFFPAFLNTSDPEKQLHTLWLLPFIKSTDAESAFYAFLPLAFIENSRKNDDYCYFILPWVQSRTGEQHDYSFLPLFWYSGAPKASAFFTPVFSYGSTEGQLDFLNVLGPVYNYLKEKDSVSHDLVWPIFHWTLPDARFRFFPLLNYRDHALAVVDIEDHYFSILGRLLFKHESNPTRLWAARFPFHYGAEKMRKELQEAYQQDSALHSNDYYTLLLFSSTHDYQPSVFPRYRFHGLSKFRRKRKTEFDAERIEQARLNLFLFYNTFERYRIWNDQKISSAELKAITQCIDKLDKLYREDKYEWSRKKNWSKRIHDQEKQQAQKALASLLEKKGVSVKGKLNDESLAAALIELGKTHTETVRLDKTEIPFFFHYESLEEDFRWDILWLLAQKERIDDYRQFNILKYLYRREQKKARVTRDIFPFIQYDTSPGKTKFSFLYRIFNYEDNNGETNGHILFIPF